MQNFVINFIKPEKISKEIEIVAKVVKFPQTWSHCAWPSQNIRLKIYSKKSLEWNVALFSSSQKECDALLKVSFFVCILFEFFSPLPGQPDWAIYYTLGNFSKPVVIIILPKSPIFRGNFCKDVKIVHFLVE